MIGIKDQCFGVEVEMTGITRKEAAEALASYFGTSPRYIGGIYDAWCVRDSAGKDWKIMSDASIRGEMKGSHGYTSAASNQYQVEMVTPKLTYVELPKLQECVRQVRHAGAKVNDSCGIHIHVDAANHNRQSLKNLIGIMYSKEDILFKALQVSESRAERWCKKVREPMLLNARRLSSAETKNLTQLESIWYEGNVCDREHYSDTDYEVEVITHEQSDDIAGAVNQEEMGAGDQGIMYGYACLESDAMLPAPVVLAHRLTLLLTHVRKSGLISGLLPDGKAQVSVEYAFGIPCRLSAVVLSCQHEDTKDLALLRRELMKYVISPALRDLPPDEDTEILINPSGRFVQGGFEADTGLTGRKLMVDTYGGLAPHGGGALSGKDGSKVDRSGAYMARYIAKNIVAAGLAEKCTVSLAYAIGCAEPVAVDIDTHLTGEYSEEVLEQAARKVFDLTPAGMIRTLKLDTPVFAQNCNYGHFTHKDAPWEQTDKSSELADVCGLVLQERSY